MKPSSPSYAGGKWSLIIITAALVLRVVNLIFLSQNDPAFYFPQVDSLWHHLWAIDVAEKSFWGHDVYFRGPLYPYLLALIYTIFGSKIFIAKLIQTIGGAVICWLIYRLGASLVNERAGRIAGIIAVFYGPMIFYESELLLEWLAILTALGMLVVISREPSSLSSKHFLFAGIFGGLSAIARPNILPVLILIGIWILWKLNGNAARQRRLINALIFAAGIAACILPVTIRNYVVADDLVLISSQGGVNFHIANNAEADGLTMVMPEMKLDLSIPWSKFVDTTTTYARSVSGHALKASEVSDFWSDRAWDYILDNPGSFIALTYKRLIYMFSGFENSDQADIYQFRSNSPVLSALIFQAGLKFPFGIISPLAIIGLVLGWQQRRKLALLYLFLLGYIPTIIVFLVTARHRLAVVVILIIFAALAIDKALHWIRAKDNSKLGILIGAFLVLAVVININWFDLGYDNPAQFHYQRGLALEKQGDINGAIGEYREAIESQPLPEALNNLGFALAKTGDRQGAYNAYQQAMQSRPNYADAMVNLGLLFSASSVYDSAEYYLSAARRINPNLPQVYLNLGDVYVQKGELQRAEQIYQDGIQRQSQFAPLYNALANLYLRQNRETEAKTHLEKAVTIDENYAVALVNLGSIYLNAGDANSAQRYYHRAIDARPDLKAAYVNLGLMFLRANAPDSARVYLQKASQLDPNDAQVKQMLERLR